MILANRKVIHRIPHGFAISSHRHCSSVSCCFQAFFRLYSIIIFSNCSSNQVACIFCNFAHHIVSIKFAWPLIFLFVIFMSILDMPNNILCVLLCAVCSFCIILFIFYTYPLSIESNFDLVIILIYFLLECILKIGF